MAPEGAKVCSHGWSEAEPVVGDVVRVPAPDGAEDGSSVRAGLRTAVTSRL